MNFKQKIAFILSSLGLTSKARKKQLSEEDWAKIESLFKEKYGTSLSEAMAENLRNEQLETERSRALEIIHSMDDNDDGDDDGDESGAGANGVMGEGKKPATGKTDNLVGEINALVSSVSLLSKENRELRAALEKVISGALDDRPVGVAKMKLTVHGSGTTLSHLFGIAHPLFDMKKRWNMVAHNPAYATLHPVDEATDGQSFRMEVQNYGRTLASRYDFLKRNNLLIYEKLNSGFTNDFTQLKDAGLGDQYVVLRQDALIARVIKLQNVYDLYPRRYGVQDRELMTNAFFTEISQAYQEGEVFKGSMELQPEMGYVDDAMAKIKFGPLKEIERKYIGYLNTDGSDPVKWGMIEWQLLQIYTQMVSEQNRRRIRGCYVKPEPNIPGSYLNTSTGLIYTLVRYMHENALLPHTDDSYNDYTETTFLDAVLEFIHDVKETLDEDIDLEGFSIYLNRNHRDWWINNCRTKYGKDSDFSGPMSYVNIVPDSVLPIKWVPNMGQSRLIHLQEPGNLQCLEFLPGEMLAFKLQEFMEKVLAWSTWKEGFTASFVGKHFTTPALLKANNYSLQRIFCNKPATALAANATTITAGNRFWFLTADNSAAKALPDITAARKGVVYLIECNGTPYPTPIAKAGKFADLGSAYTPTDLGDYIMVVLNNAGNFVDLERRVGGVRTINVALQPNVPGAR